MPDTYDVVIVGGAAMGSSIAYHLLADPGFRGRVLVIEKDPTYRRSASALSAASIRQQFSSAVNIRISLFGIAFLRGIGERLAVDGERPDIALREGGYLYLASRAGAAVLEENHALQSLEGADIALLKEAALPGRFPWLNAEDLACGTWGRSGEGWFDGWGLLQAYRRKARSLGAEYRTGRVVGLDRNGGRVTAARFADGTTIACGAVANCAGAGGRALAALAGIEIPVSAKRRSVFSFACARAARGLSPPHRHHRRLVPAGGRGLHRRRLAGGGRGPGLGRRRSRDPGGRLVALRGAGLAGACASGAGLRGDPAGPRLGRPLRHEPPRPQRHRRAGRRGLEPSISATASPATGCSNRRPSAAASPSSSCTGAIPASTCPTSATSASAPTGRSSSAT